MYDMTDNLWLDGAERAYAALYVLDDTPWDYRTPWDLYQFVYDNALDEKVALAYLDEDRVDLTLDDLTEDEAVIAIENYIRRYDLIDAYNDWKKAV